MNRITIDLECDDDIMDDIVNTLELVIPYMADNVVVYSAHNRVEEDRPEYCYADCGCAGARPANDCPFIPFCSACRPTDCDE